MQPIAKTVLTIVGLLSITVNVFSISEFDLPVAKIYEVDENDRILDTWDKIVNSEAVLEGVNSVRLECTANHPVQWIYSGNGIPVSSSKITFSRDRVTRELETKYKASVFINPLKEHHTGKYQCSSTEVLDLETYLYVYVPGRALFTSLNGRTLHFQKNDTTIVIPCSVSNPDVSVTLEKQIGSTLQQIQVKTQTAITYNPRNGFTVKLDELEGGAEGTFVCTAKHNHLVRGIEYTLTSNRNYNPFLNPESSTSGGCSNHTCGINAVCLLIGGNPTCQCEDTFIGDADESCILKCDSHTDCPDNKSCFTDNECRSPCLHSVVGCGPGSMCRVEAHKPVCFCPPDFVGDPMQQCVSTLQLDAPTSTPHSYENFPQGDRPYGPKLCKSNDHCDKEEQCRRIGTSLECVDGCQFTLCGLNAKCSMVNHNPHCSCQTGFYGDPYGECNPIRLEVESIESDSDPNLSISNNANTEPTCRNPEKCGPFSKCRVTRRGRDRCLCKEGYIGQPPSCSPNSCVRNRDCRINQVCRNSTELGSSICMDICAGRVCGEGSECKRGSCKCSIGSVGDPHRKCTDVSGKLGQNCNVDYDCGDQLRCQTTAQARKCIDPCTEINCNSGTICVVNSHAGNCVCPIGYTGNIIIGCTKNFSEENLGGRRSRSSADCLTLSCGSNGECRLVDGEPTCFCQSGFVGSPPHCRTECLTNLDCPEQRACVQKRCRNACFKKCGKNAKCTVDSTPERTPICTCLEGYNGNPIEGCSPGSS